MSAFCVGVGVAESPFRLHRGGKITIIPYSCIPLLKKCMLTNRRLFLPTLFHHHLLGIIRLEEVVSHEKSLLRSFHHTVIVISNKNITDSKQT